LATAVANLAAKVEKISSSRPQAPTPDEVNERIAARRDEAIRRISEHTEDARVKLVEALEAIQRWADENLGVIPATQLRKMLADALGDPL
jgi:hypothetical protein